MFGIGGGEMFVIILVALMLFGSDKIPEIARTLGKGMRQLKDATNDIKYEIHKSAEVEDIKKTFTDLGESSVPNQIQGEIDKVKGDIEDMTGPIKRMH
ncbi:twin-arginine translocase TatA/TatE family subunit [Flavobacterium sp. RNTU_13]|uniref:Sec-independent protein translocase subunit TatA/TatB n=1 Tax=Flavobacterium sp. RNTU_13 TaxID=3375145 RepID=UPI00398695D1